MKRFFAVAVSILLILSLCGCGSGIEELFSAYEKAMNLDEDTGYYVSQQEVIISEYSEKQNAISEESPSAEDVEESISDIVPSASEAEESISDIVPSFSETEVSISEDGSYYSKKDVSLYIHTYGKLPQNFITKAQARELGWEGGSVEVYAPGKAIGGDYFGNYEGLLAEASGRKYTECDINTKGKSSRGAERIVFSNDGLVYYTADHYESFELLYGG